MTEIKTVKISDKGQISIPKDIRERVNMKEGDTIVLVCEDKTKTVVLMKSDAVVKNLGKTEKGEGKKTMLASEQSLKKDWNNDYDERWNKY